MSEKIELLELYTEIFNSETYEEVEDWKKIIPHFIKKDPQITAEQQGKHLKFLENQAYSAELLVTHLFNEGERSDSPFVERESGRYVAFMEMAEDEPTRLGEVFAIDREEALEKIEAAGWLKDIGKEPWDAELVPCLVCSKIL